MNFERFGRLNSKKLAELMKNDSPLYDMGKYFPYLPTRSKDMDQRHTISSFKNMMKKYRYCYSLIDSCVAHIKRKGLSSTDVCKEIDNKVYVFTNISDDYFDPDDCDLLFDRNAPIAIQDESLAWSYETNSVLSYMKKRKLSPVQYDFLEAYLQPIKFVYLQNEYLDRTELDEAVLNEFIWRMALFRKGIYKEGEIKEVSLKKPKSRDQNRHSLFQEYDRYGSLKYIHNLDYLHSFARKLDDLMHYNQTTTANKLFYEHLEKYDNTFLIDEFTGDKLLEESISIITDKIRYLYALKENYAFLKNHYSKEYRHFFGKRKKVYSLYKTHQIMRKLKKEYSSIDNKLDDLHKTLNKLKNSSKIIDKALEKCREDLGKNGLPNKGCGFVGDGLSDDDGTGGLMDIIREEGSVQILLEKQDKEREEKRREDELREAEEEFYAEQAYEEHVQQFAKENTPLELFEYDAYEYFNHYKSISIKEVLNTKELVVTDDVSLEGNFFSFEEMNDWLGKRLFHFSFVEFDID